MKLAEKTAKLREIKEELLEFQKSPLYEYRKKNDYFPVIGEGNHDADLIVIGEAPGENEAKTGRPFCGRAGNILDELLSEVGIKREDIYITNILKDRPPENRDPTPDEIEIYTPFLDRQIEIIDPKIIACLGRFSSNYILTKFSFGEDFTISKIHGKIFSKEDMSFVIAPLFHPAASIYRPKRRDDLIEGFKNLRDILND